MYQMNDVNTRWYQTDLHITTWKYLKSLYKYNRKKFPLSNMGMTETNWQILSHEPKCLQWRINGLSIILHPRPIYREQSDPQILGPQYMASRNDWLSG